MRLKLGTNALNVFPVFLRVENQVVSCFRKLTFKLDMKEDNLILCQEMQIVLVFRRH